MPRTDAQMEPLKPLFTAIYMAAQKDDGTFDAALGALLTALNAGAPATGDTSANPIRDVPPKSQPELRNAKQALDRTRLTNIKWEGGDTVLVSLADVLRARRQVEAWAGPALVFSSVNLKDGSFNLYATDAQLLAEAQRRYDWLHQSGADLIEYLCLTGWMGTRMSPEPGMGVLYTPCDGPQPWAGCDLQAFIDKSISAAAAGKPSGM